MELPLGLMAVKERSVLVLEDEPWLREDLVQGLTGIFAHVTACKTVKEAMDFVRRGGQVDAALVDLALPDGSGLEVIAALRLAHPRVVCVVLSVFDEDPRVVAALRVGADGYLLKETPIKRIAAALQEALDGGAPLSPRIARAVVQSFRPQQPAGVECRTLTRRERDVLTLLAKGLSYEEVGRALGIRLGTVQSHIKRMYTRLDINTKAEAALVAAQLGLV
jgi:DNA-binding NarL/FixJ family response regulator